MLLGTGGKQKGQTGSATKLSHCLKTCSANLFTAFEIVVPNTLFNPLGSFLGYL